MVYKMLAVLALMMGVFSAPIWAQEVPEKGGTLIFARGGDSVALDPAGVTDGESLNVTDHIFDNLVTFKSGTTEIIPQLASSWTISKDGLQYSFTLQKNVKFHDDTPFNAKAVEFAFLRQQDPKHPGYAAGGPYGYFGYVGLDKLIKKIEVIDDLTVRFDLARKDATFLAILAMQAFAIPSPTALLKDGKSFAQHPVGTGAFVFKSWQRNDRIVLTRNENYWGQKAYLDTLIFRAIPDNNTRLLEMMSGRVHVMDNPNPDDIAALKSRMGKGVVMAQKPGLNVGYLAMNNLKKPFDNQKVRAAIRMAINKDAIIQAVYAGMGQVANNPMPPELWGHNNQVPAAVYDPVKAKALLAEAGFPNGFSTTLWAMPVPRPYMPNGRKVAESIQADLTKIGVKAEIVSYEWGTYLEKLDKGEHDMALFGWTADIGDPDNFLYVLLDKDNAKVPASNVSFYTSEKVHKLLLQAKMELDQKKREKLYRQAQMQIYEDVPMVPLAHSIDTVPHLPSVKNFVINPTGRRLFSDVWLMRKSM